MVWVYLGREAARAGREVFILVIIMNRSILKEFQRSKIAFCRCFGSAHVSVSITTRYYNFATLTTVTKDHLIFPRFLSTIYIAMQAQHSSACMYVPGTFFTSLHFQHLMVVAIRMAMSKTKVFKSLISVFDTILHSLAFFYSTIGTALNTIKEKSYIILILSKITSQCLWITASDSTAAKNSTQCKHSNFTFEFTRQGKAISLETRESTEKKCQRKTSVTPPQTTRSKPITEMIFTWQTGCLS